ncbi:hypothetical protein [Stenotrophomonas sp. VV52]|uniref:hypothetical protein n=1 Tax=Stenotrophomonas sp. VV52 TaxID=2066958 RepID=UPI000C9DE293|nr:hypothetical protein [Stenotrophomonas sp. VV52]
MNTEISNAAVPGAPTHCKECGSTELEWFSHVRILNAVQQGQLNTHDVGCVFVLGCIECSESLSIVKAEDVAGLLNAAPPAQGIDLGQVREAVEMAMEVPIKDRTQRQRLAGLLALIDSQPTLSNATPPQDLRTQLGEVR